MENDTDKMVDIKTLLNWKRNYIFLIKLKIYMKNTSVSLCLFIGELSPLMLRVKRY